MPRFSRLRTEPFALGLSTSLLLVPPALAETEEAALTLPSQLVSVRQDPAELDHIDLATPVSAGSRLGLSALDTPASTSSISGEEVRRRNNPSVQAAVTRSPGISFIGTPGDGGTGLSARGFSGHASVMQLFDGTRLYTGMGTVNFPSDPWMVERIDVIRGPASVLYGEGATGAVINVVPKKPFAGEIRNHLRLGYGSYDNRQLALDSGGSLTDSLSYRLNLNQQQSHGWIDRGDSRNLGISAALRWQASDDLAFTLAHDYGDQEPMNDFGTPLVGGKYHKRLREKNYNVRNDVQRYNDQWTRLTSDWSLSDSVTASNQLYYIKARRHWRNAETYEWDVPREELLRRDYLRISHEQEQIGDRQTFAFQHALFGLDSRTLVGAEYNRIRFRLSNNSPYTDVGGDYIDPWHPAPGYFESRSPYRPHSRSQTRTFALFAENRLQLNERLSLVTGVRRDQNHIDRDDLRAGTRSDRSLQGGNWRAGMVFALTPELSLYGQYSTSEDGVSNLITLNAAQQQMDLTHSKQTEVGLKQLFPDGRGEWTLAAYHIVKKKLLSANPLPPHALSCTTCSTASTPWLTTTTASNGSWASRARSTSPPTSVSEAGAAAIVSAEPPDLRVAMSSLHLDALHWSPDASTELLRGVHLEVPAGSFVGLIGPNGSGKTSLLRCAFRYARPQRGRVVLDGDDLWRQPPRWAARRIAVVLQEFPEDFGLAVEDVVAMGRTPHKGLFDGHGADDRQRVRQALLQVGLEGRAASPFASLSGGEKQRALLARALVQEPRLLILDEPTNHLDPRYQLELLRLLRSLGLSTLASFHDLNLAAAFCDRLYVLDGGRIVAQGTPTEVLDADLLWRVFGVRALVDRHPLADHPRLTWITQA